MPSDRKTPGTARAETTVFWFIALTYPLYALGALYIAAPVVGWLLAGGWLLMVWRAARDRAAGVLLPLWVLPWLAGSGLLLLALLIGHLDQGLGIGKMIKSSIGWAKGWALMPIFLLVGAMGVRPERLYRAACWIGAQTLILLPVFVAGWLIGLPERLYVSPLQAVGGPGPEFFAVQLYEIDPGSGMPRWRLFAPWAPAAGMMGCLYFLFSLQEKNPYWRTVGVFGAVAICLMSMSRLALVGLVMIPPALVAVRHLSRPLIWYLAGIALFLLALGAGPLLEIAEDLKSAFIEARAGSSRVRALLADIALTRWREEAFWWGHGIVDRGPHLVEYMPIGSHHSWYGLLFVKGLVGALALAIPMMLSLAALALQGHRSRHHGAAFVVMLLLALYSFGENLEILAYLYWPGLVLVGAVWRSGRRLESQIPSQTALQNATAGEGSVKKTVTN